MRPTTFAPTHVPSIHSSGLKAKGYTLHWGVLDINYRSAFHNPDHRDQTRCAVLERLILGISH